MNACVGLSEADRDRLLVAAKELVDAKGVVLMISDTIGKGMGSASSLMMKAVQGISGIDLKAKAEELTAEMLWRAQSGAIAGMGAEERGERWQWFHKAVAVTSGTTAGFFGAPGLLWDIPVTTGIIMRSVAEIARSYEGENLAEDDTKRACIEVFALGGPGAEDDEADAGYWSTRFGLSHVATELLIRTVASRFGLALTEKLLAQAVPIAGAAAGAVLNYAFIDYYQRMARVHFAIRDVERRAADPSAVRACLGEMVRQVRRGRGIPPP